MDRDGSHKRQITHSSVFKVFPTLSPDGKTLAFAGIDAEMGHLEIYVADKDGTGERRLTVTPVSPQGQEYTWSSRPSWSVDGTKLAFASTRSGSTEIWTMNADGTDPVQLTFSGTEADYPDSNVPTWSPDGKKIAYFSGHEKRYGEVWVMNADGSERIKLTDTGAPRSSDNPCWSPDGTRIAFDSSLDGQIGIWIVSASGGEPRLLAHGFGMCPLAWLPDDAPEP